MAAAEEKSEVRSQIAEVKSRVRNSMKEFYFCNLTSYFCS